MTHDTLNADGSMLLHDLIRMVDLAQPETSQVLDYKWYDKTNTEWRGRLRIKTRKDAADGVRNVVLTVRDPEFGLMMNQTIKLSDSMLPFHLNAFGQALLSVLHRRRPDSEPLQLEFAF
jgi:hypothetical protein